MTRTYMAYRGRDLVLETWASAPVTQHVEEAAYQERLNRGELSRVVVRSDDPHDEPFTMHATESTAKP